jgi:hypothetical protein
MFFITDIPIRVLCFGFIVSCLEYELRQMIVAEL